jgi:hypothetical protein
MHSSNKLKFRHWDNKFLFQQYERAVQLADKIDTMLEDQKVDPDDLPMSMIPTDIIYDIALGYTSMYDKLLEHGLLVQGYPKQTNTTH